MFRAFAIYRIAYRRAQNKLYYTQMCTPMCTPYCTRASWPRVHVPRPRLAATLRSRTNRERNRTDANGKGRSRVVQCPHPRPWRGAELCEPVHL